MPHESLAWRRLAARGAAVLAAGTIGATLVATGATAEPGARLRQLAARVVSFVSDGDRYVAWQVSDGSPLVVFDTVTGRRRQVSLPEGCHLREEAAPDTLERASYPWPAAASRFLVECANQQQQLLNVDTGALIALPANIGWGSVGQRYVEGDSATASCPKSSSELKSGDVGCDALYNLATGSLNYHSFSNPSDLDRTGAPSICGGLSSKVLSYEKSEKPFDYNDGILAYRAPKDAGVKLDGCRGRGTVVRGGREVANIDARGGLLTWDSGHQAQFAKEEARNQRGTLFSYVLSTRRRQNWALPSLTLVGDESSSGVAPRGAYGCSSHTATMVFWIATRSCNAGVTGCEGNLWSVYAAPVN